MRNPERIIDIMYYISVIWKKQPDTRLNQLIHNLQAEFNSYRGGIYSKELWEKEEHRGVVAYRRTHEVDLFNVEDELFAEFLRMKVEEIG